MPAGTSARLRRARRCCGLGCLLLLLPPAWFWLTSDPARREWVLSQPGMGGMGGGPAQLWALVGCLLTAALLLGLGRWLRRTGQP